MGFSVAFEELDQYPRGQWNRQGFTGWRKLLVNWEDADTLIMELMAYPNNIWPTGKYTFGNDFGLLDDIKVEPYGAVSGHAADNSYNSYPKALLTLTYATRLFGLKDEVLISESFSGGLKQEPVTIDGLQWGSSGLPVTRAISRSVPTGTYSVTFYNRLVVPTAAIALQGCVNNAPWASFFMDGVYPSGTLMMLPTQINRVIMTTGEQAWTYSLNFAFHPVGHNYVWNPTFDNGDGSYGGYDYYADSEGNPVYLYPLGNFGLLRL